MGYRSDSIAISRDMGPLSVSCTEGRVIQLRPAFSLALFPTTFELFPLMSSQSTNHHVQAPWFAQQRRPTKRQTCNSFPIKNLLMPLFLMGCFPGDFQEVKRPLGTKSEKRPIEVGKRPIKERIRPIKAKVLVGVLVGCLMGCFRAPPPCGKRPL